MTPYTCPACAADLSVPGGYSRVIGIEVRGVYDGVLFWHCPDCGHDFHRWPADHHNHRRAEPYVTGARSPWTPR